MDVVFLDHRPIKMRSNITWDAGGSTSGMPRFRPASEGASRQRRGGQPGIQHKQVEDVNTNFPDSG